MLICCVVCVCASDCNVSLFMKMATCKYCHMLLALYGQNADRGSI